MNTIRREWYETLALMSCRRSLGYTGTIQRSQFNGIQTLWQKVSKTFCDFCSQNTLRKSHLRLFVFPIQQLLRFGSCTTCIILSQVSLFIFSHLCVFLGPDSYFSPPEKKLLIPFFFTLFIIVLNKDICIQCHDSPSPLLFLEEYHCSLRDIKKKKTRRF